MTLAALLVTAQAMVDEISALGLRHVGYGISTDLLTPFVTAHVEAARSRDAGHRFGTSAFGTRDETVGTG